MRRTSGALLYRRTGGELEVLLVRAGAREPWSIPQGAARPEESLEAAARRETAEETGLAPDVLVELGAVEIARTDQRLACFAGETPPDAALRPPPWLARAEFLPLMKARKLIHPDQRPLLDRLVERLSRT